MNNKAHKNISFSPSLPTLADLRAFFRAHDWSASSLSSPSSRSPDKQSDMEYVKRLLEAISDISDFIRCYEHAFMAIVKKRNNAGRENDIMVLNATLVNGNKRIKEIDRIILQAFEANADGCLV